MKAHDPHCHRDAVDIPDVVAQAARENMTPDEYATLDGTYNPKNGHFACDECYINLGMPANPVPGPGWVSP